jgi:hypothetical protein
MKVKDKYDEVFGVEIDGWCYGITHYPGEIHASLIHRVIKELRDSFKLAVEHNVIFNVLELSARFSRAAKYLVPEREIAFSVLAQLPNPAVLDEDAQFVLAQIIDQVEQTYGNALAPLQRKWRFEKEQKRAAA